MGAKGNYILYLEEDSENIEQCKVTVASFDLMHIYDILLVLIFGIFMGWRCGGHREEEELAQILISESLADDRSGSRPELKDQSGSKNRIDKQTQSQVIYQEEGAAQVPAIGTVRPRLLVGLYFQCTLVRVFVRIGMAGFCDSQDLWNRGRGFGMTAIVPRSLVGLSGYGAEPIAQSCLPSGVLCITRHATLAVGIQSNCTVAILGQA